MSYTKQGFKSGDKLTAAALNAMDEQIYVNSEAADSKVSAHNVSEASHADIRELISELRTRLDDSGFITKAVTDLANYYAKSETYTREEVTALIAAVKTYTVSVVSELPASGAEKVIYLVVKTDGSDKDAHNEYLWVNGKFEFIGTTAVDLTGYATEEWVNLRLAEFVTADKIVDLLGYTPAKESEIPTKVSQLENDSGYAKQSEVDELSEAIDAQKFNPTTYDLPVLYLTGDISPITVSKDNKVTLDYVYGDLSGTCTLKGQGATSYKMAQALVNEGKAGKFNYTINFDTAFEAADGWGSQKKYCLKANWIDHSHSRNVVSAKLWGLIVKSRTPANANLSGLVNGGAVDGFPIVIMLNGEFHGLYTFNIPKDGWMFGLVEDTTKTQAVVGANDHETATQFKGLLAGDESDFELEFVSDEDNADWVTTSLNTLIQSCIDSWGGDLDTTVAQYLDWDSAIDYYIWVVVCKGTDMVDKNYLLTTFDGTKWLFSAYDMDSTYGLNWDGSGLTRAVSGVSFESCATTHRVYELIKRFKTDALKARYNELRSNVLSETRICQYFENFAWAIPSPVAVEDVKKYPTVQGSFVNGIDQICRFVRQRLEKCDEWINALPAQETPVEPEKPVEIVNQVPISTDTDGSIYNGVGYKDNARLSSSGGVSSSAQTGSVVTGFIPWTNTDVIRMKGAEWIDATANYTGHYYLSLYDSSKTFISDGYVSSQSYAGDTNAQSQISIVYDETTGVTTFSIIDPTGNTGSFRNAAKSAAYFRINAYGSGADLIVTVNQEITE